MAYDEGLAERIRGVLSHRTDVTEKRMFGGLAFLSRGYMLVGINDERLMARVGAANYDEALRQPHVREMDFTKRPIKGFVYVLSDGIQADNDLKTWIDRCLEFVDTLPDKADKIK